MEALTLIAQVLDKAVTWTWLAVQAAAVVMGAWALIDAALRAPEHYAAAGKRTKGFWVGVNAAGIAVVLLMGAASMIGLLGVVANAVYLADVRPALRFYAPVKVRSTIRIPGRASQRRPQSGPRDWRPGR